MGIRLEEDSSTGFDDAWNGAENEIAARVEDELFIDLELNSEDKSLADFVGTDSAASDGGEEDGVEDEDVTGLGGADNVVKDDKVEDDLVEDDKAGTEGGKAAGADADVARCGGTTADEEEVGGNGGGGGATEEVTTVLGKLVESGGAVVVLAAPMASARKLNWFREIDVTGLAQPSAVGSCSLTAAHKVSETVIPNV